MSLRIGLIADLASDQDAHGARARLAAATAWLVERDVDLVAVDGDSPRRGGFTSLALALGRPADTPVATVLVAGPPAPDGPLVANASLATGAPTVVVSGYLHARESRAAGPVLELGQRATGEAPCACAMVEIAHAEDGALWVWHEAGRLAERDVERAPIRSATLEAWTFDGSRWRLGSARDGGG
ncbi:MAG TPA: hypothetical protein VFF79_11200 [Conexibacter sp.]|jgi:hypothetical protein|nr:hypothetical protein [Conexibacter sp.]